MYLQTDLSLISCEKLKKFIKDAVQMYPSLVDILPNTVNASEDVLHNRDANLQVHTENDTPK